MNDNTCQKKDPVDDQVSQHFIIEIDLYNKIYNFQGCGRRDMDEPLGTNLDCYVDMPNIPFRTGRTDCDSGAKPYIGKKFSKTWHLLIIWK